MFNFGGIAALFSVSVMAGLINSVAGGGSLLSFPALVMFGQPAILANATNTAAIGPGALSSAIAYRQELKNSRALLWTLAVPCIVGGLLGAVLLVITPPEFFRKIVPFMVLFATLLFTYRNRLTRLGGESVANAEKPGRFGYIWGFCFQLLVALYGGYFGAGIGILMLGSLSVMGLRDIHRMNGLKTLLSTLINLIAFIFFAFKGLVVWPLALWMAAGTVVGGYAGARLAKRIEQRYIRGFVIGSGFLISLWLLLKS